MDCSLAKPLGAWDSPGKNSEVGSHSLVQGSNLGLLHSRQILYSLRNFVHLRKRREEAVAATFTLVGPELKSQTLQTAPRHLSFGSSKALGVSLPKAGPLRSYLPVSSAAHLPHPGPSHRMTLLWLGDLGTAKKSRGSPQWPQES